MVFPLNIEITNYASNTPNKRIMKTVNELNISTFNSPDFHSFKTYCNFLLFRSFIIFIFILLLYCILLFTHIILLFANKYFYLIYVIRLDPFKT